MTARPALDAWIALADAALDEAYRAEQRDLAARVFDFAKVDPTILFRIREVKSGVEFDVRKGTAAWTCMKDLGPGDRFNISGLVYEKIAAPVPPRSSGTAGEGSVASPAKTSQGRGASRDGTGHSRRGVDPREGVGQVSASGCAGAARVQGADSSAWHPNLTDPFAPGGSTHNERWEASTTDTGLDAPQRNQRTLPTPPAWLDKQLRRIRLRIAWRTAGR